MNSGETKTFSDVLRDYHTIAWVYISSKQHAIRMDGFMQPQSAASTTEKIYAI